MRIASLADVKAKLSAYLREAETSGPVLITRNGKAVALLLAQRDNDDLERLLLSRSPRFQALMGKSRASIASGGGLRHGAFWKAASRRRVESAADPSRSPSKQRAPHPLAPGGGRGSRGRRTKRSVR